MHIGLLRRLDIWVGRPLCWLITLGYRCKRLFVAAPVVENPQRILIIKLFGIGSMVLAIPALDALRLRFPQAELYVLTFGESRDLLTLTGHLPPERILVIRKEGPAALAWSALQAWWRLVRLGVDVAIDMEFFSRFTAIFCVLIRARAIAGFYGFHTEGLKRGSFIDLPVNYNHTLHTSRAFFTLLRPLGVPEEAYRPTLPQLPCPPELRTRLERMLLQENPACGPVRRWIALNPGSSELIPLRDWPEEYFIRLMGLLLEWDGAIGVVLTGGPGERAAGERLCAPFRGGPEGARVVNLAGRTTLEELLGLFHRVDFFVTVDSGPAHLAAMTPVEGIVLFGPETPALYAPLSPRLHTLYLGRDCQPCVTIYNGKRSHCTRNLCLREITPERLFALVRARLAPPAAGG